MSSLKVLNARRNKLVNSTLSNKLFELEELAVLVSFCLYILNKVLIFFFKDFSYNEITEIPFNLDECKTILVLNLSHNKYLNKFLNIIININCLFICLELKRFQIIYLLI